MTDENKSEMTDENKSEGEILTDFLERDNVVVVTSQENIDKLEEKLDEVDEK